jgi:hypothetical protein
MPAPEGKTTTDSITVDGLNSPAAAGTTKSIAKAMPEAMRGMKSSRNVPLMDRYHL